MPHRPFSPVEEWANAAIHGFGALLGLIGLIALIVQAGAAGRPGSLPAVLVYGIALVLLYAFSTLHHATPEGRAKQVFLALDHAGIYLLIAGTYTPFCLLLPPSQRTALLVAIWVAAGLGMALQLAAFIGGHSRRYEKLAFLLYLAMGWLPLMLAGRAVFDGMVAAGLAFLVAGGLAYSLGVVFYLWRRLPFSHAVWHLFVVGGSALHFVSVFVYVVPAPA